MCKGLIVTVLVAMVKSLMLKGLVDSSFQKRRPSQQGRPVLAAVPRVAAKCKVAAVHMHKVQTRSSLDEGTGSKRCRPEGGYNPRSSSQYPTSANYGITVVEIKSE